MLHPLLVIAAARTVLDAGDASAAASAATVPLKPAMIAPLLLADTAPGHELRRSRCTSGDGQYGGHLGP